VSRVSEATAVSLARRPATALATGKQTPIHHKPHAEMRFAQSFTPALLLLAAGVAQAASAWAFDEGSLSVVGRKSGEAVKEKCAATPRCP
jgi:hypothetical protein